MDKNSLWVLFVIFFPLVAFPQSRGQDVSRDDSLALQEIADSLHVPFFNNSFESKDGRVTFLSIYYKGQSGAIPSALGRLDSLRQLKIAITNISSIPKEIGQLKRLDTISIMTSNVGPSLPSEIGELSNLRYLRVGLCSLTTLPATLMKLQGLEYVDFSYNRICVLDNSLKQWLLGKWPDALNDQDTSACITTRTRKTQVPKSDQDLRQSSLSDEQGILPKSDQGSGDEKYYTAAGRRLGWKRQFTNSWINKSKN